MSDLKKLDALEIQNMRTIIGVLYFSDEVHKDMNWAERMAIIESMLQTYLSQGVTYSDLSALLND